MNEKDTIVKGGNIPENNYMYHRNLRNHSPDYLNSVLSTGHSLENLVVISQLSLLLSSV